MAKAREVPGLHAQLPYREAAAATVRVRVDELFEAQDGVLDTKDIERVHAMRVATRRLRAVLEIYRPCFDQDRYKPVLRDVKALADALGARRDPDVQLEALTALGGAMPRADLAGIDLLADEVRAEQAEGNALLAVALDESTRSDLHGRLLALVEPEPVEPELVDVGEPVDELVEPALEDRVEATELIADVELDELAEEPA